MCRPCCPAYTQHAFATLPLFPQASLLAQPVFAPPLFAPLPDFFAAACGAALLRRQCVAVPSWPGAWRTRLCLCPSVPRSLLLYITRAVCALCCLVIMCFLILAAQWRAWGTRMQAPRVVGLVLSSPRDGSVHTKWEMGRLAGCAESYLEGPRRDQGFSSAASASVRYRTEEESWTNWETWVAENRGNASNNPIKPTAGRLHTLAGPRGNSGQPLQKSAGRSGSWVWCDHERLLPSPCSHCSTASGDSRAMEGESRNGATKGVRCTARGVPLAAVC